MGRRVNRSPSYKPVSLTAEQKKLIPLYDYDNVDELMAADDVPEEGAENGKAKEKVKETEGGGEEQEEAESSAGKAKGKPRNARVQDNKKRKK